MRDIRRDIIVKKVINMETDNLSSIAENMH